jgi:hypothetical protein
MSLSHSRRHNSTPSFQTPPQEGFFKSTTQVISIIVGLLLFTIGLCGFLDSSFIGLHFSLTQSFIIFCAGVLLSYFGYYSKKKAAFFICLFFGVYFGILSFIGFTLGSPGTPNLGYQKLDQYLIRIIPHFYELAFLDHLLHGFISIILLIGAYDWKRKHPLSSLIKR